MYSLDLKPIPSLPAYAVARGGCVLRIWNKTGSFKGKTLRLTNDNNPKRPYDYVRPCSAGRSAKRTVHSLVAETWLGPRPNGTEVDHVDGQSRNNSVSNLEYVSRDENLARAIDRQRLFGWHTPKSEWAKVG